MKNIIKNKKRKKEEKKKKKEKLEKETKSNGVVAVNNIYFSRT